jgi:UDP-N-acetyl-D-glucosamine dehydrogenase
MSAQGTYIEGVVELMDKIKSREAVVGVVGLGYVGLPQAIEFCAAGFPVMGFDVDEAKVDLLRQGRSYINYIESARVAGCGGRLTPTSDFSKLGDADCILICLPTPLNAHREPDMSYVFDTAGVIARHLRKGQLVVLESTTYPGTTDEDLRAILEETGLRAGRDFHLSYCPEREDPNNGSFTAATTPKVVSGCTESCLKATTALYEAVSAKTVPVSSTRAAEAVKLLENIYRAVNIAMVNELKMLFDRMGIDIWEVIEAASTKPFGFQPFYPGPGLGGHCIPIDPFYLTWKARQYDFSTRFIELSGEINTRMPEYVVERAAKLLNDSGKALKASKVLVLGAAYKKDVDDKRESPAIKIIHALRELGSHVCYSDPHVPEFGGLRNYPDMRMESQKLTGELLEAQDLVVLVTDHSAFDYAFIEAHSERILDTRNAFRRNGITSRKVYS